MELVTPKSRSYYYECSNGRFRLNYYLSFKMLESLVSNDQIRETVLKDFPDGFDLDCTEADFADFKRSYNYQHPFSATKLCQTFKSIFTSTKNWTKYKGSGWIPADFLESRIKTVSNQLFNNEEEKYTIQKARSKQKETNLILLKSKSIQREKRINSILEKIQFEDINRKKYLDEQFVDRIKMEEDTVTPEVFFTKISKQN